MTTTSLLNLLDRLESAAGVYERSDDKADRDELHAARRAIMEAFAELTKERDHWREYSSGQGKLIESGVFVKNEEYAEQWAKFRAAEVREAELVKALIWYRDADDDAFADDNGGRARAAIHPSLSRSRRPMDTVQDIASAIALMLVIIAIGFWSLVV